MRRRAVIGVGVFGALAVLLWLRAGSPDLGSPDAVAAAKAPNARPAADVAPVPSGSRGLRPAPPSGLRPVDAEPIATGVPPPEVAGGVVCRLASGTSDLRGVTNLPHDFGIYQHGIAWASGRELHLNVHQPTEEVYVHLVGYVPMQLDVVRGADGRLRCDPEPVHLARGEAFISGLVRNAFGAGEGRVWVEGCGAHTWTDSDGSFELSVLPGACELRAFRRDGRFVARGTARLVQAKANDDVEVDLVLEEFPAAGLGVNIEETDRGIFLPYVLRGGGGYAAGLRRGDIVLEIDGEETVDLALGEFADRAMGQGGTDVELTVLRNGEELQFTVRRRTMGG